MGGLLCGPRKTVMGRIALWIGILSASLLSVLGQLLIKWGVNGVSNGGSKGVLQYFIALTGQCPIWAGLLLYGLSMLIYLRILAQADLITVGFAMSCGYVFLLILSHVLLHEAITATRLVGAALIISGVVIMSR